MKVYIAVKLTKNEAPKILGVFTKKADAEQVAYTANGWGNVIEQEVRK